MSNQIYRKITRLARPWYPYDGPNSWQHIQEVRRRAAKMMRKMEGRPLTPAEYGAILMHDSTKWDKGGENHGRLGAQRAATVLAAALSQKDLKEATTAISVHDDNLKKFPSHTAEVLASADANPPDLDWVMNKSYNWAIRRGLQGEDRYKHILEMVPVKYGSKGSFNPPGIYKKYYVDRYQKFLNELDNLTLAEARERLDAYRAANNIGPDETVVVHNV